LAPRINRKQYPAAYDHVIAVASTDKNDRKASTSNFGDWVDVAAPGNENIFHNADIQC
jgi:thermitase